ncbi:MAG TPA: tetratricopeptide repeat protein [Ramlibacter sp.]|nr:tetratricopeptide repeat protein [Ramlibacter sp.]
MTAFGRRIGIGWTVSGEVGADNAAGLHVVLQLLRKKRRATLLAGAQALALDPLRQQLLAPALADHAAQRDALAVNRGRRLAFPVLHLLGDRLALPPSADATPGQPDIGLAAIRHLNIPDATLHRIAGWPLVLAGSLWNVQALRSLGLSNVSHLPAGVDLSLFHPAPRAGMFPGRFVVFCAGPLGHAHGQDIVLAAFRHFRQRRPEALLLCTWGEPAEGAWAPPDADRVPPDAMLNLGPQAESQMPAILHECDLAVFAGRCEGAPPAAAMQAMACGVPTILAGNTGHLDLVGDHVYVLKEQADLAHHTSDRSRKGWGESSVEELLALMERAHARRGEAAAKGRAAARFMQAWSFERQVDRLLAAIARVEGGKPQPPAEPDQNYRWALCLHRAGQLAEAEAVYSQVLQHEPTHLGARIDRGHARRDRGASAEAQADFRAALAARPDHPQALQCLGNLLRHQGQLDEAADCLQRALAGSDAPSLHWDLAFTLLLAGRYAQAWPHFDYRHAALGLRTAHPDKPRWDGRPVGGVLLVLDEQGLGDTLQFLRFLPLIPRATGGRVIFAGKPATLAVVRRLLPSDDVFDWDRPLPGSSQWAPLMSLPRLLRVMAPQDLPAPPPGPLPEPERIAHWQAQLRTGDPRPVVALAWRGNPDFPGDARRSPGLAALRPLLELDGIRFVSLQLGPGREEIAQLDLADRLEDVGGAIEAAGAETLDTLAVLESCDFVISSCTSVTHMAGLARRPGCILLCDRPDWRWMTQRPDTPWYPTLRLIRQGPQAGRAAVAREAAEHLMLWMRNQAATRGK